MRIAIVLVAIGCLFASAACRQQSARGAQARAKAYGVSSVRIVRDVVYAEYGERRLKLDVYLPPESGLRGALPGVLAVRGGAWRVGDKEFFGYIAGHLAMEGFVSFSIEYRAGDEGKFPAAVHDVKAAVRWIRAHAAEYGVNPDAIGAIGGSAGAHLVAMLATSRGVTELEGAGGNAAASSEIQAAVAMGGAYNLHARDRVGPEFIRAVTAFIGAPLDAHAGEVTAASPVTYVSSRSAPLLLLHSETDPLAPFAQSVEMQQAYRRAGASVRLVAIEAPGSHAFWLEPRYFPEAKHRAAEFFRRHLRASEIK